MGFTKAALALAAALVGSANAQTTLYDAPINKWVSTFLPMKNNNGLVWAPDDLLLYATSIDGSVAALNPDNGNIEWTFQPTGDGTVPFSCNGEVSFAADGSSTVYAVTEGDSCKVYALSHPFGDLLWSSPALEGTCEGTPYYTTFGDYVFVTHNSGGGTVGHFSVLDTAAGASVFYEYTKPNPFAPFAFFRQPSPGGNFGAGSGNVNDLAVWGYKPNPGATFGEPGGTFGFQMPPPTSVLGPSVTTLLNNTSWRHTAPPLLAANGQELYWLVSRSKVRAWIDKRFSSSPDGEADFERGSPLFKAAPYTPVVNDIDNPTVMCGGPAGAEFACLSILNITNETMATLWTASGGLVYGDPLMSTGGNRVYWIEHNAGLVSAYDPFTGIPAWTAPTGVVVEANPELSSDGAHLFFADTSGAIVAWEIAAGTLPNATLPPRGPTAAPTELGTAMPSSAPTATAPVLSAESIAPSGIVDTSMPSAEMEPTPAPILTAAPVMPRLTSGASRMAVFSVIAASFIAAVL